MKKTMYAVFILAMAVVLCSGSSYAGNGKGNGTGTCRQICSTGISQNILAGTPFVYEGTVVSICSDMGVVIATEEGNVTVYGIGPVYYWNALDVDRPLVGDAITASGYMVNYSGVERNIVMSITIDGIEVQLRDPVTAKPLW